MQETNVETIDITKPQDQIVMMSKDAEVKKDSEKLKEIEVKKEAENKPAKSAATGAYLDDKVN